jgi:hypothetical protein
MVACNFLLNWMYASRLSSFSAVPEVKSDAKQKHVKQKLAQSSQRGE